MIRTVAEARQAAADEPKRWKAAVVEATTTPLLDDPSAKVQLYLTKKHAGEVLRERKVELEAEGYKLAVGSLGRGVVILANGDKTIGLGLDYRGRRSVRAIGAGR